MVEIVFVVALRAYPEGNRSVDRFDGLIAGFYQKIDILPPPTGQREGASALLVFRKALLIKRCVGGRIKVIVKMNAVHVVVFYNLGYPIHNQLPRLSTGGVVGDQRAILDYRVAALGDIYTGRIVVAQRCFGVGVADAVGVDPRFNAQSQIVGSFHHNLQWIVSRILAFGAVMVWDQGKISEGYRASP